MKTEKVVDTRQAKEMIKPFVRAGWVPRALKCGDYQFGDSSGNLVLIEDKPVGKLIDDIQSGVLDRQCLNLVAAAPFPILLIRGPWIRDAGDNIVGTRGKMAWQAVWDRLESYQRIGPGRLSLQLATSTAHAIQRIFDLEEKYQDCNFSTLMTKTPGNPYVQTLRKIQGIGLEKALVIERAFPTLALLANARPSQIETTVGVGKMLSRRIHEFCHRRYNGKDY